MYGGSGVAVAVPDEKLCPVLYDHMLSDHPIHYFFIRWILYDIKLLST